MDACPQVDHAPMLRGLMCTEEKVYCVTPALPLVHVLRPSTTHHTYCKTQSMQYAIHTSIMRCADPAVLEKVEFFGICLPAPVSPA